MPSRLQELLLKPLIDNPRNRRYQAGLDVRIDNLMKQWDLHRGLILPHQPPPGSLPHETNPGYWRLSVEQRREITPEPAAKIYELNAGRFNTAPLCEAAFCYRSSLSRHRGNPDLLSFFSNGLNYHVSSIDDVGLMNTLGLNGEFWAHGWDVEGLIYGIVLLEDALDPALVRRAKERFHRAADRVNTYRLDHPMSVGSYGNQRCVWLLALRNYGELLGRPDLVRKADEHMDDVLPRVLDETGQVIEQLGPCMHYSYTAFAYAWLHAAFRNRSDELQRVLKCLQWFRNRHTASLYPIAGPTTRLYYESPTCMTSDLWPAAEQVAHLDPSVRQFVDGMMAKSIDMTWTPGQPLPDAACARASGHDASTLMWSMLMMRDDAGDARLDGGNQPFTEHYKATLLIKRPPMTYLLARRRYQTHFNFTDFLPFSGVQTWAFGDEPPIIHPTPLFPSTTQAYSLDTARQGASHNWAMYGAGALGVDGYSHEAKAPDELWLLVARYDWLWRVVTFTDLATVIIEFGRGPQRRTFWTLNRIEQSQPAIGPGIVRFQNRRGCLHTTLAAPPQLQTPAVEDEWATGVRQLLYDCGDGPVGFALSDDSFQFEQPLINDRVVRFSDAAGRYELTLDERFFQPNPGNFRVDTYQLAHGSTARRK